jgi:uncharacterized membrane protein YgcG
MLFSLTVSLGTNLPPAMADDDDYDWRIDRYHVSADVAVDGTAKVSLAIDFDFGRDPGHGPYLTFPLRQRVGGDPDHWRMLDFELKDVNSPTGANVEVSTEEDGGNLLVRVGNAYQTFTGVQTYVVEYTLRGLIAPRQAGSGLDELNWNVVGDAWEVPILQVTAEVTGPADVERAACFTGSSYAWECESAGKSGRTASFAQSNLGSGEPLQIVAGFPPGTFVGAQARTTVRYHIGNMFALTPITGVLALLLSALALWKVWQLTQRQNRDEYFLGLTPGTVPVVGQQTSTGRLGQAPVVAVAFAPPADARPGELGTLMDSTADDRDIAATIVDLAVRRHLRLGRIDERDWSFQAGDNADQSALNGYEGYLLHKLFGSGPEVTTKQMRKSEEFANMFTKARAKMYERVAAERRWYRANPQTTAVLAMCAGSALVAGGVVLGLGLGFLGVTLGIGGYGLLGLPLVLAGALTCVRFRHFGQRTAQGSAVLEQAKGFELYLATAEADQLRFEEGEDVFSKYLPYAIAFGIADRWTKLFEDLAAQGRYTFNTGYWFYTGYAMSWSDFRNFDQDMMHSLSESMGAAMQKATGGTSGGSGFSGGGGFGGGGGGGW